jgi:hypothetical protein
MIYEMIIRKTRTSSLARIVVVLSKAPPTSYVQHHIHELPRATQVLSPVRLKPDLFSVT